MFWLIANVLNTQTGQRGVELLLPGRCLWMVVPTPSAQGEAGPGLTGTGSRWVGAMTEAERAWLLDNVRSQATFVPSTYDDITLLFLPRRT